MIVLYLTGMDWAICESEQVKLERLEWLSDNVRGGIRSYWIVPGTWPGDPSVSISLVGHEHE